MTRHYQEREGSPVLCRSQDPGERTQLANQVDCKACLALFRAEKQEMEQKIRSAGGRAGLEHRRAGKKRPAVRRLTVVSAEELAPLVEAYWEGSTTPLQNGLYEHVYRLKKPLPRSI